MEIKDILALYNRQQRIEIEFPDMRKEITPHVTRFIRPAPGLSQILHSQIHHANADDVIEEQIAYFSSQGLNFTWKVFTDDSPDDLVDRLEARGFEPDPLNNILVLELDTAPASLLAPVTCDVRRATDPAQLQDVITVEQQVWGKNFDWIPARLGSHMQVPGYISIFIAYVDDLPACTGWTYYNLLGQFAGLWGGSTVPEYRQQGLYTAILATRVQEAIQRGYCFLTIEASPMSQPIVSRHAFQVLTQAAQLDWLSSHPSV